jgi:hypothetical protein
MSRPVEPTRASTKQENPMAGSPSPFFDMAISHFWTAQNSTDATYCVEQMTNGLQQFCAAVQDSSNPNPQATAFFKDALSNFWAAQSQSGLQQLLTVSMALQQFCAATKSVYNPQSS